MSKLAVFVAFAFSVVCACRAAAVEVTVYNQNLGLVKETRTFDLHRGVNDVRADDVAALIDPTSVHFKSLSAPNAVGVLEQNFEYDLVSPEKLLEKYVGKPIALERFSALDGKRSVLKGILLSTQNGRVLRGDDGKIYVNPPGNPVLAELPEGLESKPTLLWKLQAEKGGKQACEISYLTQGLSWSADYVLVVGPKDRAMDLNAWVTLNNASGAAYKNASLKLVAGDVHRAVRPSLHVMRAFGASESQASQFSQKAFFEYHLYTLKRPTTLRDDETKQIQFAEASDVPVRKVYTYMGSALEWGGYSEYSRTNADYGVGENKKVWVDLEFVNSARNHLGIPLPAGRARVYKADSDGSLQFIGEDSIDHTPKDERVKIRMGDAFDIVASRKRSNFVLDTHRRRAEESFEISLGNHKDEDIVVEVVEPLYRWSSWSIARASQKWSKLDARTIRFDVPVKAGGAAAVSYTVRYAW
ncbi:MAG: DUF4139 domain-containing protein [Elusimicrobia bacterium]|nr:DUF4139 domain-containing protein [Elusimicrobiota bacterium]MDE2426618.1 DUF4139 domain-containing protein [Elusimicrobiota bacterium]